MDLIKQIKEAADKKNFEDLHSNDQSSLTAMALTVKEKEKHIANLEEQLKKANADLRYYRDELFPSKMEEAGVIKFHLKGGGVVTLEEKVKLNILKDDKPKLYDWMRKNGHDSLIRNVVSASFKAGEDQKALDLLRIGTEKTYDMQQREDIATNTLEKWYRAQVAAGDPIPEQIEPYYFHKVTIK
mgnify:FL=1|jgi:hypothetical protein|tara:strand:+ start:45 stop:599 length:555 start_codon:yes stop_codon:yes gene_type:complete